MKNLNISTVKFKHLGNEIELDIKSPYLLIYTSNSGDGKSYLFEALRNYLRFNFSGKLASVNYNTIDSINEIISSVKDDKDALLMIDNIELIDRDTLESLKLSECQVIMFGRFTEHVKLGSLNRAILSFIGNRCTLTYPLLKPGIEETINSLRGKKVSL